MLKKEILCPYCKSHVPLRRCLGTQVVECTYCYDIAVVTNQIKAHIIYLLYAVSISFIVVFFEFKVSLVYIFPLFVLYILGGITIYSNTLVLNRELRDEPEI